MIYLCCDTNIWINISNGLEPPRLLNRLNDEVRDGNIKLLLPEIILKEWERNKERFIVEQTQDSTTKQIDSLKKLNEFLEHDEFDFSFLWDEEIGNNENEKVTKLRDKIEELISELKEHKTEIINRAKKNVETVESIFKNPNTIVLPTDSKSSMTVVGLATEKKFPLENEKNNFADALIFYQFINYLKDNGLEKGHFVTSNKKEFFPNPKKILHESLQKEIDDTKSFFYKSLSEALNKTLNEELVNFKELKRIEELAELQNINLDEDIYYCLACDGDEGGESILHFSSDIEIIDERSKIDKNQLALELEDEYVAEVEEMPVPHEAESAVCGYCGTEHIVCPECKQIWDFMSYKINQIQNCESCNLRFKYVEDKDRKGMVLSTHLELLDDYDHCSKCGTEFDASESGIDICEKCNEEYINK